MTSIAVLKSEMRSQERALSINNKAAQLSSVGSSLVWLRVFEREDPTRPRGVCIADGLPSMRPAECREISGGEDDRQRDELVRQESEEPSVLKARWFGCNDIIVM